MNLSLIILIIFAVIGVLGVSILAHEAYHAYDFYKTNYTEGEICVLNLQNLSFSAENPAYFSFRSNFANEELEKRINKHAELRAYIVSALVQLIGFYAIISFFWNYNKNQSALKTFESKYLNTLYTMSS